MKAIFKDMCPNCWGPISDSRLALGLPCSYCLPSIPSKTDIETIVKNLERPGDFLQLHELDKKLEEFKSWFKKCVGSDPWNLQQVWAKRVLLKRNFAILAPTGIGKTTFGLVTSTFLEGKAYLIFPTTLLVKQALEKLSSFPHNKRILAYHGSLKQKEKQSIKEEIKSGNFDILITTTMFLYRNFDVLKDKRFSLIFVDDVDSFLKSAKNIDKALMLLGFSEQDIQLAMEIIALKAQLAQGKDVGKKLEKLKRKLEKAKEKRSGIMIVSSATAKPKSKRVRLFRELLDFEVGKTVSTLRNIDDYVKEECRDIFKETLDLVKKLGPGGLVFLPSDLGREGVNEMVTYLNSSGIPAIDYEHINDETIEQFKKREIWVLIGIASYRNPLARGIDLPQHIRYAIFSGVPKIIFPLKLENRPGQLLALLIMLRDLLDDKADYFIAKLRKYESLPSSALEDPKFAKVSALINQAKEYLQSFLSNPDFLEKIKASDDLAIKEIGGELKLVVGDVTGYIQASGRTSRMYGGGISKGLSILLVDDKKAYNKLIKQISWFIDDFQFRPFDWRLIEKTLEEVDRTRKEISEMLSGKIKKSVKSFIKSAGVIVESPNKARTIASFFGKPLRRLVNGISVYEINTGEYILNIMASQGHVFDLVTSPGLYGVIEESGKFIPIYDTIKRCGSCGYQFVEGETCPKCGSKNIIDKKTTIKAIQELAKEVNLVLIASDPDTEGEKIAWDISLAVRPFASTKRIEFHEITKSAFLNAIKEMRDIDENRVNAQITRRIADRWVGFKLSQILQRVFKNRNLSAGRVQSPVLNWIIERWFESKQKKWVTEVLVAGERIEFDGKPSEAREVNVVVLSEKIDKINPLPPYTTDTMLRDASKELGFDSTKTMELAQDLFEGGFITYHRTDSTRVSNLGMRIAKEYISKKFGEEYFHARRWKSKEGEGAHECIRPTRAMDVQQLKQFLAMRGASLSRDHLALYELIFRRFIRSQMRAVKAKVVNYKFRLSNLEKEVTAIENVLEHGWDLDMPIKESKIKPGTYIPEKIVTKLVPKAKPYTFGEIITKMKEEGIGRPSTYAKIIQTLLDRKYILAKSGFLIPTKKGILVNKFLQSRYRDYVSVEFTRELEEIMDKIETGYNYQNALRALNEIIRDL